MKPRADQLPLDFEGPLRERRAAFRAAVEGIARESCVVKGPKGDAVLSIPRWENCREVLKGLFVGMGSQRENHLGEPAYAQKQWDELLNEESHLRLRSDRGRHAYFAARRDLEAMGLVACETDRDRRTGAKCPDRVWIVWEAFDALVATGRQLAADQRKAPHGLPARGAEQAGGLDHGPDSATGGLCHDSDEEGPRRAESSTSQLGSTRPNYAQPASTRPNYIEEPYVPTFLRSNHSTHPLRELSAFSDQPSAGGGKGSEERATMIAESALIAPPSSLREAVAALLAAAGVGHAGPLAEELVGRGATEADVAAVVAVWRAGLEPAPPAWGVGGLVLRLRRLAPGAKPEADWPPQDPAHATQAARLERERRKAEEDRRYWADRAEREQRKQAIAAAWAAERMTG